jgi:hypothetical protein
MVGLVMSLGIDPPTRDDLGTWTRYGQTWLWTTMDQWNTWTPLDEEMCLADPGEVPSTLVVDKTAKTATTGVAQASPAIPAPAPAAAPEASQDQEFAAIVDEMIVTFLANETTPPAPAAHEVLFATSAPAVAPIAPAAEAEVVKTEPPKTCTATDVKPAEIVPDELAVSCPWSTDPAANGEMCYGPTVVTKNEPTSILAHNPAPTVICPIEVVEEAAPALTFDPFEVSDDPYVGMAYELNRESMEGLVVPDQPAPAVDVRAAEPLVQAETPVDVPGGQRLATAVRLTGEALHAWATLLQGPAVVSIRP